MIRRFRVRNFKILTDVSLAPTALNVLIGPNGCGKSSLLQSIDFIKAFFSPSIDDFLSQKDLNYRDLPNIESKSKSIHWEIEAELGPTPDGRFGGVYAYTASLSPRRYLAVGREQLDYTPPSGAAVTLLKRIGRKVQILDRVAEELKTLTIPSLTTGAVYAFTYPRGLREYPEMFHFVQWVRRIRYFLAWDPRTLRQPARGAWMILGPSGEHFAPVLAGLKKRHPEAFEKLLARIRRFFPNLSDISFTGQGWGWRSVRVHEKRGSRDVVLNNRQVSDGFLRLVAITSFLYLDPIPQIVMFEEPENGVHPRILREMVQVLREITLRKSPRSPQVFFTTHSPYVLDEFYDHPAQVWIMDFTGPRQGTQVVQLSDKEQLKSVKKSFDSLGEAWFFNALGGNPRSLPF